MHITGNNKITEVFKFNVRHPERSPHSKNKRAEKKHIFFILGKYSMHKFNRALKKTNCAENLIDMSHVSHQHCPSH